MTGVKALLSLVLHTKYGTTQQQRAQLLTDMDFPPVSGGGTQWHHGSSDSDLTHPTPPSSTFGALVGHQQQGMETHSYAADPDGLAILE